MIRREQRRDGPSRTVLNEPQILWLGFVDKNLQVIEAAMLVCLLPENMPTGNDHFVRVRFNRRRSRDEGFIRRRTEHVVGIRMIQRDFLRFQSGELRHRAKR